MSNKKGMVKRKVKVEKGWTVINAKGIVSNNLAGLAVVGDKKLVIKSVGKLFPWEKVVKCEIHYKVSK